MLYTIIQYKYLFCKRQYDSFALFLCDADVCAAVQHKITKKSACTVTFYMYDSLPFIKYLNFRVILTVCHNLK